MKSTWIAELNGLLDQFDARRRRQGEQALQRKVHGDAFLERFADVRRNVVRPLLSEAGTLLQRRGHSFTLNEQQFSPEGDGAAIEACIALRVRPAGSRLPDDELPTVALVTFYAGSMVHLLCPGELPATYAVEQVDSNLVERAVVRLFAALAGD